MCSVWIRIICIAIVKITVILPAVNAALKVLREIRVLWDPRGAKEMQAVPVLREIKVTRAPWALRGYPASLVQEDQEEIQVR